jgi:hypothetical protein
VRRFGSENRIWEGGRRGNQAVARVRIREPRNWREKVVKGTRKWRGLDQRTRKWEEEESGKQEVRRFWSQSQEMRGERLGNQEVARVRIRKAGNGRGKD